VREIAGVVDAADAGEAIGLEIEAQVARAEVESLTRRPVRVFYAIWKKPWMAINATTYIHDVLTRAGAINVTAEGDSRYPVLSPQELKPLSAALVLLPSEPFVFQEAHRRELLDERLFGPEVPVALVDGKDFSWHGSHSGARAGQGARGVAAVSRVWPARGSAAGGGRADPPSGPPPTGSPRSRGRCLAARSLARGCTEVPSPPRSLRSEEHVARCVAPELS
jgi:hypothetical protein